MKIDFSKIKKHLAEVYPETLKLAKLEEELEKAIDQAKTDERERCAKLCEQCLSAGVAHDTIPLLIRRGLSIQFTNTLLLKKGDKNP